MWLLIVGFVVGLVGCGQRVQGPRLEFNSDCQLVARGLPGQSVRLRVPLWNTGSQPLVIRRVQTTCGCSVVGLDRNEIEPDGQGILTLEIHIESSGRGGEVIITSNDPRQPVAKLPFQSEPVTPIECSDRRVVITVDPDRGQSCAEVRIYERDRLEEPYRVKSLVVADVLGDGWRAELEQQSRDWLLRICYTGAPPAVSTTGLVWLEGHTARGTFRVAIEVVAENATPIFLAPPTLWLRPKIGDRAESDELTMGSVFVVARRGELPDLTEYQTELPLRVEFERRNARRGLLRLIVRGDQLGELFRASWPQELRLTFGNNATAVLRIIGPETTGLAKYAQ